MKTKTAFKNYDELARVWVDRCQVARLSDDIGEGHAGGKEGNRWRMTFNNCTINSYGHWTMAMFVLPQRFFIIRSDKYSPTTSNHQRAVRSAIASRVVTEYVTLPYDWWYLSGIDIKLREHNEVLLHRAVRCRSACKAAAFIDQAAAMSEQVQTYQRLLNQGV